MGSEAPRMAFRNLRTRERERGFVDFGASVRRIVAVRRISSGTIKCLQITLRVELNVRVDG